MDRIMPTKSLSNSETGYQGITFENMLQECVECGIFAVDSDGKIPALTPVAERTLSGSIGKKHPPSLQRLPLPLQEIIREAQTSGQPVVDRQIVLNSRSAGTTALTLSVIPMADGKQNISVIVLLKEVSAGNKMTHNLQRLDRLASVGMLSASMAHEIKNALVAIKTFVDLQLEKSQDSDLARVARREVGRVNSIVTHMLKFAAPAQPAFAAVQLHDLLDHSLKLVQHRVEDRMISFKRKFSASPDSLTADDHQLEQAFVNILFNAVEAMKSAGTLTVTTDLIPDETRTRFREGGNTPKSLRIKITDTGAGISPENLAQIFEPFFTTKENGTGLGLAVTRRIIEEHNGTVHVESRPDHGTTFIILLPAGPKAAGQ
jgi:signal transduction histidine kinase